MIPLYKPYMPELPLLKQILYSGELAYGSYTKQFEEALKEYFGTPHVIVTNSFNTAISVLLSTWGIYEGDEVIASPMACLASTQPYASSGLKITWADVNPKTGTLCPDSVKQKISKKTKAIVHNHFCGYPGFIDEINQIGKEHGIPVIDDGIECFGATYKSKKVGNCGTDATVFSFNPVRIPNTIDGGAVIFNNKDNYEKSLLIRDCGIDRTIFRDDMGEISIDCDISLRGYGATMSNVNGYIGFEQMKAVDNIIVKQRTNAKIWDKKMEKEPYTPLTCTDGIPNYWVYGILAASKQKTIEKLRKEGYFASGVHMKNNVYSIFGKQEPLKGVDEFYEHFIALPCGWWMEFLSKTGNIK